MKKMIMWSAVLTLMVSPTVIPAEDIVFTNLQQAVGFIATALDSTNFLAIGNACADANRKPNDGVLKSLQGLNQNKPFRQLYAGKEFPTNTTAFKLGGHMSELGFTHIDFMQTNGVWRLQAIWICK